MKNDKRSVEYKSLSTYPSIHPSICRLPFPDYPLIFFSSTAHFFPNLIFLIALNLEDLCSPSWHITSLTPK